MKKLKPQWALVDWDGNPSLRLKCWRKQFGRGHVSVGAGDFTLICFSYGANSDASISSTRRRSTGVLWTTKEAMAWVDKNGGKCRRTGEVK